MRLEVLISFDWFRRGQIIELPDGVANLRIARGFCREVVEKSVEAAPRDKMIRKATNNK